MRIACVPLDSRPVNWQFPQRLADIAGIELALPPRNLLGTLTSGADRRELLRWLRQQAREADAAVFSWDVLVYGGLVQSRDQDLELIDPQEVFDNLSSVDWSSTAGYCFVTLPRLGITTSSGTALTKHEAVRELFIAAGDDEHPPDEGRLRVLIAQLGESEVELLFAWRRRNLDVLLKTMELSAQLGLRRMHVAVEDNAPRGPHLDELRKANRKRLDLLHDGHTLKVTSFDGADEAGCLLLARAELDQREAGRLDVQLTVHPPSPGAHNYRGLYETHTLQEGLEFLEKFLGLRFTDGPAEAQWLVAHGVQPQPDAYSSDPERLFVSPYLLPREAPGRGGLFVSDLAVCNAANPHLASQLAEIAPGSLSAIVGFNTNFNSLGVTAALLSLGWRHVGSAALKRFALERLADDLVYQALARHEVVGFLRARGLDPLNFRQDHTTYYDQAVGMLQRRWQDWIGGSGAAVLRAMDVDSELAQAVEFSFPWHRAFEVEAIAPTSQEQQQE